MSYCTSETSKVYDAVTKITATPNLISFSTLLNWTNEDESTETYLENQVFNEKITETIDMNLEGDSDAELME